METRICSRCQKEQPITEYNWRNKSKGTRIYQCKNCWNLLNKERYNKQKQYYVDKAQKRKDEMRQRLLKMRQETGCMLCNEKHPACLEYHHRDPSQKEFTICDAVLTRSWESIISEIEKCDVLCSNCHRKTHWNEKMVSPTD